MKDEKKRQFFIKGLRDGLPIGAGYFAVSFSLGITAKLAGLTAFQGFLASILTNASAGEYAGFLVILEDAGFIEMIAMTVVASARYFLMACALSQRFSPDMKFYHRLLIAFDLTDEIFGAQIARPGYAEPAYAYGLFVLPLISWSLGTMLGVITGNLLQPNLVSALSVALYGMFIAIIIPPAKHNKVIAGCVAAAFAGSFALSRLPAVKELSSGTRTIILTLVIAGLAALLFPVKDAPEDAAEAGDTGAGEEARHA